MKKIYLLSVALLCLLLVNVELLQAQTASKPVKVEIRMVDGTYQLIRGGEPYFVKGAGGTGHLENLASYGGNSIRTWGSNNGQRVLDSAAKHGLTVLMGLSMTAERHNFDYNDPVAVKRQFERIKAEVIKYKDHPALLAWGIGNELNLQYSNPKVWDAVNDVVKMIHEVDPNHPAGTILAGINKKEVDYIKEVSPDMDFLGINMYGDLATLPERVRNVGWKGAYLVTEWGPTGHWESLQTEWKMPIEETSSEKASVYRRRYEYAIERDQEQCLGSYVFLWGQKQERTPTWYGLFTEKGEESEVMDVMQYLWSGKWPVNRAPHIYSFQLDGKKAADNIYLKPGSSYAAVASVYDPDQNTTLSYHYELLPEPTEVGEGGDFEERPDVIENPFTVDNRNGMVTLKSPEKEGAYRLFVYASDGHNKVATANIPFYVKE